jgi:hypothetical protein
MWLSSLRKRNRGEQTKRRDVRLALERLEDRLVPTNYTAANVNQLIADINTANQAGGSNIITLTAPTTSPYILTAVNNTTDGVNGMPVIAKYDNLTIVGNGDTIERDPAAPDFRLFDVASGGSLTLETLTLQNGRAVGSASSSEGGAIYNRGTLDLNSVTVQDNLAFGGYGSAKTTRGNDAAGGGIWSSGTLTLEKGTTVKNNDALGGYGGSRVKNEGYPGGNGFGGGVYVAGGTANLTDSTLYDNGALGGTGGEGNYGYTQAPGGFGEGGGLCVAGGTVSLCNDTVTSNGVGGYLSSGGVGGGLYIAGKATVYLDSFTVTNAVNNNVNDGFAPGSTDNIDGSYTLRNC